VVDGGPHADGYAPTGQDPYRTRPRRSRSPRPLGRSGPEEISAYRTIHTLLDGCAETVSTGKLPEGATRWKSPSGRDPTASRIGAALDRR
jgi:hypothetical protein